MAVCNERISLLLPSPFVLIHVYNPGWIAGLFPKEDIDGMLSSLRNEAKSCGIPDTPDQMLAFLISRIKANLHVVLCFSPVGDTFRVRARRFPALIMNTAIDFFHPWPREALISVAYKFLAEVCSSTVFHTT
jgi:dynein heavy chain